MNELNPNSCNWTLAKITMFESLFYKKFLVPAMTYDDFYMTTILNKLRCFQKIIQNGESHEYFFIYNGTSTKTIIVKQPAISYTGSDYLEVKDNQELEDNTIMTIDRCVEDKLNMTREKINSLKIQIFLVAKQQNIIMNMIPERRSLLAALRLRINAQVTDKAKSIRNQILANLNASLQKFGENNLFF